MKGWFVLYVPTISVGHSGDSPSVGIAFIVVVALQVCHQHHDVFFLDNPAVVRVVKFLIDSVDCDTTEFYS
jgi:hypothetical protein